MIIIHNFLISDELKVFLNPCCVSFLLQKKVSKLESHLKAVVAFQQEAFSKMAVHQVWCRCIRWYRH